MIKSVEVRCLEPLRRDALEEAARLVLSFVAVSSRPGRVPLWRDQSLRLTLSPAALHDGCYLADAAQQVLDAVQAFGIQVVRADSHSDEAPPEEWSQWWASLETAAEREFDLVLEIV